MLTNKVLVVAMCGIGAIAPALAEDQPTPFQYSPVARLLSNGQYRAEIWRRDVANGQEDRAWSNFELHASSAKAMDEACTTLRKYFDGSFSCAQISSDLKAAEIAKEPAAVSSPKNEIKAPRERAPVPEPKAITGNNKTGHPPIVAVPKTATGATRRGVPMAKMAGAPEWKRWVGQAKRLVWAPAAASSSSNWGRDFWANQSRWSHGGGEGGGGGGGDGSGGGTE